MTSKTQSPAHSVLVVLFVALALSIGWGVRGNWGHEYGAMIPGALAAMAVVLASGRDDWQRRIAFFAFFGALGWSFGGSISYMQVIAYTHSGHWPSVLYGFACLFLIGYLWGAMGGAGTALPAFLDRARLTEMLIPAAVVMLAWVGQDVVLREYLNGLRAQVDSGALSIDEFRERTGWMNWHDTDWIAVLVAAGAAVILALVRRRICFGTALVLAMCAGWWLGFTVLVIGLGLRMTPPRGDNWAGALGMTLAMIAFFIQQRQRGVAWTALVTGLFGGLGFTGATLLKLILINPQMQQRIFGGETHSNWHSVLEQSFGFISGIGVALAIGFLSTRAPLQTEEPRVRRWAEPVLVFFVMIVLTYVNISKNVEAAWLPPKNAPASTMTLLQPELWGHSARFWFDLGYACLAVTVVWPLWAYYRGRPLAILPATNLGKGQLFFIIFLWWIVMGNLARTVPFHEQRLITEGVIHVNACLCTLFALLLPSRDRMAGIDVAPDYEPKIVSMIAITLLIAAISILGEFALVRSLYGDQFAGGANLHIRFGPNATLDKK